MAIASVSPSVSRVGKKFITSNTSLKTDLKLVAGNVAEKGVDRRAYALFLTAVAIAGLLSLLAINTALSQGAFELTRLNTQATALNDQREAVMRKIAKASSPQVLAYRARVAGMVPSISPRFLTVGPSSETTSATPFTKAKR